MINTVILMGRLTRDPELRQTSSGTDFCRFVLAIPKDYDKEKTDFVDCIAWRKTAEFVSKYFHKGERISVVGSIVTTSSGEGEDRKKWVEVQADKVGFVETRSQKTQETAPEDYKVDESNLPF